MAAGSQTYACCSPVITRPQVCKRHGRLAAEAEAHASNVRARDELIRDMAARYGIPLHAGGPSLGGELARSLPLS